MTLWVRNLNPRPICHERPHPNRHFDPRFLFLQGAVTSSDDSDIEHDETCAVCDEDGELVQCCHCPFVYHRECHEPPLKNFPR